MHREFRDTDPLVKQDKLIATFIEQPEAQSLSVTPIKFELVQFKIQSIQSASTYYYHIA